MTGDNKPKFFYGYVIVLVGFSIQMLGWGVFDSFGVFFNPLLDEFGWTRATISGPISVAFLILGLFAIVAGRLVDKFGPRLVMTGCGLFLGSGYLLMSQMNSVWELYLFGGLVMGVGLSSVDVLSLSTVARWFVKRRGMMSGVVKIGAGTGIFIVPVVMRFLISTYGWRISCGVIGTVILVVTIGVAQFTRRDPGQKGLLPYGADEVKADCLNAPEAGFSLQGAVHTRQFWMLCAMYLLTLFYAQAILAHIILHAVDLGISVTTAATVLSTIGMASIIGRFAMGSVGDRIGDRRAMAICFPIMVIALFWLQIAGEQWMLSLFAIVYGFAHGGFFTLISPLTAELFGLKSHGVIFGIVSFSGAVGGALGPVLVGYMFDVSGSYYIGFLVCALLAVTGFVLALLLRPAEGWQRSPTAGYY